MDEWDRIHRDAIEEQRRQEALAGMEAWYAWTRWCYVICDMMARMDEESGR